MALKLTKDVVIAVRARNLCMTENRKWKETSRSFRDRLFKAARWTSSGHWFIIRRLLRRRRKGLGMYTLWCTFLRWWNTQNVDNFLTEFLNLLPAWKIKIFTFSIKSQCSPSTSDDARYYLKIVPSKIAIIQRGTVYGVDDCQLGRQSSRKLSFQSFDD